MSRISRVVTDMLVKILSKSKSVRRVCELSVVHGREAIDMDKQLLFSTSAHRTWNVRLQTSLVCQSHLSTGALQHWHRCWSRIMLQHSFDAAAAVVEGFCKKKRIDNVTGTIDGSHVPISCSRLQPADYVNRKGFYSIILQVDQTLAFTDIHVGWSGSIHDACVFSNSPLGTVLERDPECMPQWTVLAWRCSLSTSQQVADTIQGQWTSH